MVEHGRLTVGEVHVVNTGFALHLRIVILKSLAAGADADRRAFNSSNASSEAKIAYLNAAVLID